jgi:hypothetical protein
MKLDEGICVQVGAAEFRMLVVAPKRGDIEEVRALAALHSSTMQQDAGGRHP